MNIVGKTVIVTGGQSGLGLAVTQHLLSLGAKLAVFDITTDSLEENSHLKYFEVDVCQQMDIAKAMAKVEDHFGAIHIVVNCAGIAPAKKVLDKELQSMPIEDFQNVININLLGTFAMCSQAAHYMAKNTNENHSRGVVINTASIAAYEGQKGQCAYAASKGAIASMTLPLARDLSEHAIRVVAIAPGVMATPLMNTMPDKVKEGLNQSVPFPKRMGEPLEFAHLVEHIIANEYLNGEVIRLDGALRMN